MAEEEDMELTCPHRYIKNISTCGKFSQKTNWKLAENHLYKKSCKKDTHELGRLGKKPIRMGLAFLWGICKGGSIHKDRPLPRESTLPTGRSARIDGLEEPGLCSWGVCTCWLASNQGGKRPVMMAVITPLFQAQNACWVKLLVHAAAKHWKLVGQTLGEDLV